jgi:uncharacterized membrane protein YccC
MKKENAEAHATTEQDASAHTGNLVLENTTALPTLLAMVVTLGICMCLGLSSDWALGIMAAVCLAVLTALIVVGVRRQRRN